MMEGGGIIIEFHKYLKSCYDDLYKLGGDCFVALLLAMTVSFSNFGSVPDLNHQNLNVIARSKATKQPLTPIPN